MSAEVSDQPCWSPLFPALIPQLSALIFHALSFASGTTHPQNHVLCAHNPKRFVKSSTRSSSAYGKLLHGDIHVKIPSNSVSIKLNSSSPSQILVSISTSLSINYTTFLQLYDILNWFYPSPSSHISRLRKVCHISTP